MTINKDNGRQYPLVARVGFDHTQLTAGSDVEAIDLPPNSIVTGGGLEVTVAFSAGTTFDVGDVADVDRYLDGQAGTAVGYTALGLTGFRYIDANPVVTIRMINSGAVAAGEGILIVEYVIDGRATENQPV